VMGPLMLMFDFIVSSLMEREIGGEGYNVRNSRVYIK
jgi:hypothetical protein